VRRLAGFFLLCLCLAPALRAADDKPPDNPPGPHKAPGLELPPPSTVKFQPGRLLRVKAQARTPVGWVVLTVPSRELDWDGFDRSVSIPMPPEGTTVIVVAAVAAEKSGEPPVQALTTISVEGARPPPGPAPNPTPGPTPDPGPNPTPTPAPAPTPTPGPRPAPVTGRLHVTAVLDYDALTPAQAALVNSATLRKALTDAGCVFRTYPTTAAEVKTRKLDVYVGRAGGPPALIVQSDDGVVRSAVRLPADEAGVLAVVNGLRGK
jgi:hypothetical protein